MQPIDSRKEWKEGTIVRPMSTRAYEVSVGDKTYIRNRRHLRASQKSTHSLAGSQHHVVIPHSSHEPECEREATNSSSVEPSTQPRASNGDENVVTMNNTTMQSADPAPDDPKPSPPRQWQTPERTRSGRVPKPKHDPEFVYQRP